MRRLHCNSPIIGQNRWWLKLFFYLLDMRTSNSLAVYKLAKGSAADSYRLWSSNRSWSSLFLEVGWNPFPNQLLAMSLRRQWEGISVLIVHCFQQKPKHTRFRCRAPDCQVPQCSLGSGMVGQDCFALSHANEEFHKAVVMRYQVMKRTVNDQYKEKWQIACMLICELHSSRYFLFYF